MPACPPAAGGIYFFISGEGEFSVLVQQISRLPSYAPAPLTYGSVQFVLIYLLGTLLPTMVYFAGGDSELYRVSTLVSLGLVGLAAAITVLSLRKVGAFYSASIMSLVLPAVLAAFLVAALPILTLRLPYSAVIFFIGLIGTMVATYALHAILRGRTSTQLIIAEGRADRYRGVEGDRRIILSRNDLATIIENPPVGAIIVADLHYDHEPEMEKFMAQAALRGIPVYHYKQVWEATTGQVRLEHLSENSFGTLTPNSSYFITKRLIDLVSAALLLPLLLPLMAIVAVLVRIDSPGPIFFTQLRSGFRGKPFRILKFRTMTARAVGDAAEERRKDAMTADNDRRITRLGRFLRKSRLDEIPQVFNVLAGSMSWIGPRPEALDLHLWYEEEIPFYTYRYIVRPGISGWAQVSQGHVTDLTSIQEKLRYDFYYIKNFSWWLDVLIVLKTIRVMLGGFGAR